MRINLMCRKVLYVFLSLAIITVPTIQQANAASAWSIASVVSAGARSVVTATKSGYKSAINIAPTAGRLAVKVLQRGNAAYTIYAIGQLALDGVDFVIDPVNNTVKYKVLPESPYLYKVNRAELTTYHSTKEAACVAAVGALTAVTGQEVTFKAIYSNGNCQYLMGGGNLYQALVTKASVPIEKTLTAQQVAAQVQKNAAAGHAPSQEYSKEIATEMVIGGQFDQDLLAGAVPTSDNRPLVPSVPISGNGNIGVGSGVGVGVGDDDGLMTGGDVGKAADAAMEAAAAAKDAADAAKDAAKAAADAAREAADAAKDLINSAVDQAIKDAAKATADAAAQAAKDAAAVSDAAVKAANDRAAAAERAAEAAASAAKAAAAKAAKDLADAKAAGDAAAVAAAQAAKAAADAAKAAADERAAAAEKAAEKAKAEAAKPFELPAFCSWASVVCNYFDWVKGEYASTKEWVKEEPVASPAELMPIDDVPAGMDIFTDKAEAGYVSFESQCPADVLIPVSLMGATQTLSLSYVPFCHFASMIRYAVILGAWISGLLIISGGRGRE